MDEPSLQRGHLGGGERGDEPLLRGPPGGACALSLLDCVHIQVYKNRKEAKSNPRKFSKKAMKDMKVKFVAMKEQPAYLGSEELRMRDYQVWQIGWENF